MANFVAVIDSNQSRRDAFLETTRSTIAPVPGLVIDQRTGDGFGVLWAASPQAPISIAERGGRLSLLFGDALDEDGTLVDAGAVCDRYDTDPEAVWDGYFASLVLAPDTLIAGCDLLGMFPIYFFHKGGVTLVSSSPELILGHPLCERTLDAKGMVGILLTNGLVGGRTLTDGVTRLGPGCQLRLRDGRISEKLVYVIPESQDSLSLPLEGHGALLGDAMEDAVRRHGKLGVSYGMLLSGGLDSRMVAGLLTHERITPLALTMGLPSDMEVRCAKEVAGVLRLKTTNAEPAPDGYADNAKIQARFEHLSNGFSQVRDWWTQEQVKKLGSRLATGILADAVVGGVAIAWAYRGNPPRMSFDNFWENMPELRVPPAVLKKLLRPDHAPLVDQVLAELRTEYDAYSPLESQKAWRYDLAHGQRYHVGISAWRLSFGSWPMIPVLDRKLLAAAGGIPAVSMADRSAQIELVRQKLPELVRVPLDRSDLLEGVPQYIDPSLKQRIGNNLIGRVNKLRRRLPASLKQERRYWFRVNDFEGEGWQGARREVEPHRDLLSGVFDPSVLSQALPPPGGDGRGAEFHIQPAGKKLLLGLLYWFAEHR